MDFSVYDHLLKEQKDRYKIFRAQYPHVSELVCQQLFFSQIHEINLTNIINQGYLALDILKSATFVA